MIYPGEIIDNTYQVCNEIGAGGMGVIYLAIHLRLNKYVVLKKLKNANATLSMLRNEVDVLKSLRHTYLPQVYDFIEHNGDLYTIIDYIEGYDLKYYLDHGIEVTESQLIKWLKQLCEVLSYLHRHQPRILHLDIKPANVIIQTNGDVCLIDFGISMLGNDLLKGISYDYSSPEQYYNACCIDEGQYDTLVELDERTDIYSLGATFYEMITRLKPSCLAALQPCLECAQMPVSEPLAKIIDTAVSYDREGRYADALKLHRAIDGMFKLSQKYRQYLAIQIVCSAAACLLIFLGCYLIYSGVSNQLKSSFEADYNAYLAAMNRFDTETAVAQAKKLINDAGYRSMMDGDTTAEVYHGLGDVYYEKGDFQNAADCYEKAVQSVTESKNGDIYYRDYAISLIARERYQEAKEVLAQLSARYPDSPAGHLISAHLAFREGDLPKARELAQTALAQGGDSNTQYTAYLLIGDIEADGGDSDAAAVAYQKAISARETALALRKRGSVLMKRGALDHISSSYDEALATYRTIYDAYMPTDEDVFNLAQCYLLCSDPNGAKKCIEVLEDYVKREPESCRSYILLSIAADSVDDSRAAEYCRKAHSLYVQMTEEERAGIDKESIRQIKTVYKRYLKEEW
ncbi:protein kinase domain-containing protein [Ruminococcus sp.]|uniref:protein kinase domain-containing protein n=1 Tax=Ruminococcus sp. TaxID=41978 RepID=UPI003891182E